MANQNYLITYKSRGQTINLTEGVRLRAQFNDASGAPVDLDSFPSVTLIQPSGNVVLGPTSAGVSKISTGLYEFLYQVGLNGANLGVWIDRWTGSIGGYNVYGEFNFVVNESQIPRVNVDGYEQLGDDTGFHYSQKAIHNINILLKGLRARLNSSGKAASKDQYGNDTYIDCDVFSVSQLVSFIAVALSDFNQYPHQTAFTFDDDDFINIYTSILVEGATIYALSSQALIERGREYTFSDNSISVAIPTLSELLSSEFSTILSAYQLRVVACKGSMKPVGIGLGSISIQSGSARSGLLNAAKSFRQRQLF